MPGPNRIARQDRAAMRAAAALDARILNNARIADICREHGVTTLTRAQERRLREWCQEHSEPRANCGCGMPGD